MGMIEHGGRAHMTNSNGRIGVRVLDEHHKWLQRLKHEYVDIEHYRIPHACLPEGHYNNTRYDHVCVVVLKDGRCFVGAAWCHDKDQYSRKRGFRMSVGRAIKRAAKANGDKGDFVVDTKLTGKELRDACRDALRQLPPQALHMPERNCVYVMGGPAPQSNPVEQYLLERNEAHMKFDNAVKNLFDSDELHSVVNDIRMAMLEAASERPTY